MFSPNFVGYVEGEAGHEKFENSLQTPFANERSGIYYGFTVGGGYAVTNNVRLDGRYRFRQKDANQDYEAYDSHLVSGRLTWVMPRQMFVVLDASVEWQDYDGPDPFISAQTREDTDYGISLTYGMPVSALALFRFDQDPLPELVRDIVVSFTGGYLRVRIRRGPRTARFTFEVGRLGQAAMMSWTFPFAGLLFFGKAAPLLNQMKRSEEEKTHDGNHDDRN